MSESNFPALQTVLTKPQQKLPQQRPSEIITTTTNTTEDFFTKRPQPQQPQIQVIQSPQQHPIIPQAVVSNKMNNPFSTTPMNPAYPIFPAQCGVPNATPIFPVYGGTGQSKYGAKSTKGLNDAWKYVLIGVLILLIGLLIYFLVRNFMDRNKQKKVHPVTSISNPCANCPRPQDTTSALILQQDSKKIQSLEQEVQQLNQKIKNQTSSPLPSCGPSTNPASMTPRSQIQPSITPTGPVNIIINTKDMGMETQRPVVNNDVKVTRLTRTCSSQFY